MKLKFKKLDEKAVLPKHAKPGDAGMDLTLTDYTYANDGKIVHHFGLAVEIPEGYVGLMFPRSSMVKTALTMPNSVGVIDSGYRGELKAVFSNTTANPWYFPGDRSVQLVIVPFVKCETQWEDELSESERGTGGFGSTGV
jgi:dUTP pyrophosphatase